MATHQDKLDCLSVKGKQLLAELKKVPECESESVKKDMEAFVDRWLDVSGTSTLSDNYKLRTHKKLKQNNLGMVHWSVIVLGIFCG